MSPSISASEPIVEPPETVDLDVTYQEPCHLAHAQRIPPAPRTPQVDHGRRAGRDEESSLCCGSAGIYNILRKDLANELGDRKAKNTIATGAATVITANPGCYLQLRSTLQAKRPHMDVKYIVELLDEAYGGRRHASGRSIAQRIVRRDRERQPNPRSRCLCRPS